MKLVDMLKDADPANKVTGQLRQFYEFPKEMIPLTLCSTLANSERHLPQMQFDVLASPGHFLKSKADRDSNILTSGTFLDISRSFFMDTKLRLWESLERKCIQPGWRSPATSREERGLRGYFRRDDDGGNDDVLVATATEMRMTAKDENAL